jgi:uncharacterized protein (TIGR03437 family)
MMIMRHAVRILLSVFLLVLGLKLTPVAQTVKPFVTVDAARYQPAVAPDSIVSGFTWQITTQEAWATQDMDSLTPGIQLPTSLGGLRVLVNNRLAGLLYVGPNQINYIVPSETELEALATVIVTDDQGNTVAQGEMFMAASSLNIFTHNQQGTGSPAAAFTADGITYSQVNNSDGSTNVVPPGNYLVLFGTGVRDGQDIKAFVGGIEAQVDYAGPQPDFVALDQINIRIPATLNGQGVLDVTITDGLTISNTVTIDVGGNPQVPASAPVITGFSTTEASAGQVVTINGSQFPTTISEASVALGSTPGQIVATSATALTFIVPYGAASNKISVGNAAGVRKSTNALAIKTSISGTILDSLGAPVVGIPVSVATSGLAAASTDSTGRFLLTDVPRGVAQVEIDTSQLPANLGLPAMTFSLVVMEGADNEIGYPIYLPAGLGTSVFLNAARAPNSLRLEANVDADTPVVIEHDGLRLEIPGMVTFPKGARDTKIRLTRLSADGRLPAPMPSGLYPSVVAMITPIGTTFGAKGEGLATLSFPNPDGFPAGTKLDLYAFRSHVAPSSFVKKGVAVVDERGEKIVAQSLIDFATIWFVGVPADQVTFTNVVGQVVDSNDRPVGKARVFVRGRSAITDQNGKFEIKGVRAKNDDELRIEAMFFTPAGNGLKTFKLVKAVAPGTTDAGTLQFPPPPALSILLRPMEAKLRPGTTMDMTVVLSRKLSAPATINLVNEEGVRLEITPATINLEAGQTEASFKVKGDAPGKGTIVAKLAATVDDITPDNSRKGFAVVYVINPAPVLEAIRPVSGAPGSTFTLVGKGLGAEAQQNNVFFKQDDKIVGVDPRSLKVIPTAETEGSVTLTGLVPGLRAGEAEVFVSVLRNGVPSELSNKVKFAVTPAAAPKLETITPNSGTPGATFTLVGYGLDANPRNLGIFFKLGDKIIPSPVELLRVSVPPTEDTTKPVTVQGSVPRMPAGEAEVFAVVYRNGAPSEASNKLPFKVLMPAGSKLESVTPTEGASGASFTIKGTGFDREARRNFVFFKQGEGLIQLDPATLKFDGQSLLSGVVPRLMPGNYEIFVVTNLESVLPTAGKLPGTPSNALPFKVLPPPGAKLEALMPSEGALGTGLTIKGTGFDPDPKRNLIILKQGERIRMLDPQANRLSEGTLVNIIPDIEPGDYEVMVMTNMGTASTPNMPAGSFSNSLRFKVLPPPAPVLEKIDPSEGVPGKPFKITGKNLDRRVRIIFKQGDHHRDVPTNSIKITSTTIEGMIPGGLPGEAEVFLLYGDYGEELKSNVLPFNFLPVPNVAKLDAINPTDVTPAKPFKITGVNLAPFYVVVFEQNQKFFVVPEHLSQFTEGAVEGIAPGLAPGPAEVFVAYGDEINHVMSNKLPVKVLAGQRPVLEQISPTEAAPGATFKLSGRNIEPFYSVIFKQGEQVWYLDSNQLMFENGQLVGRVPDMKPGAAEVYLILDSDEPFSNKLLFTFKPRS